MSATSAASVSSTENDEGGVSVLTVLRSYPRQIWSLVALKVLFAYSYFSLASRLVVYLSDDNGFGDIQAAEIYGGWRIMMSIVQFLCGALIDRLRIRRSLIVGALFNTIGMLMIALAFDNVLLLALGLGCVVPIGMALSSAIDIGGKRYSPPANGSIYMSIGLLNSAVNIGAMLVGLAIMFTQAQFGADGLRYGDYHATADRILILVAAISAAMTGLLAALTLDDDSLQPGRNATGGNGVDDDGDAFDAIQAVGRDRHQRSSTSKCLPTCDRFRVAFAWLQTQVLPILKDGTYQRQLTLSAATLGVKILYLHIDATLPKVVARAFGEPGNLFGQVYSAMPLLSTLIVPPITAFARRFDIYKAFTFGTAVLALSMFIMFSQLTVLSIVAWATMFTFGDAIYVPLLSVYLLSIAPEGREGLYLALVNIPNLLEKIVVGPMSGRLLEHYCPKDTTHPDDCRFVWLYVGVGAMSTPLLLVALHQYIHSSAIRIKIAERLRDTSVATD